MSQDEFWNLDAEEKDCQPIISKLRECANSLLPSLDLSHVTEGRERIVLERYPFGMQGRKHGLFHISSLFISNNQLSGNKEFCFRNSQPIGSYISIGDFFSALLFS